MKGKNISAVAGNHVKYGPSDKLASAMRTLTLKSQVKNLGGPEGRGINNNGASNKIPHKTKQDEEDLNNLKKLLAEAPDIAKNVRDVRDKEPAITKDMISVAEALNGQMYDLGCRQKSVKSLSEKITRRLKDAPSLNPKQIISQMNDLVRYTQL